MNEILKNVIKDSKNYGICLFNRKGDLLEYNNFMLDFVLERVNPE